METCNYSKVLCQSSGQWVVDFRRNGDETNYEVYARQGEVVRIRLNPKMGNKGFVK